MPRLNKFQHQSYPTRPAIEPVVETIYAPIAQQKDYTRLHRQFNVRNVLLVHGTFVGEDPLGVGAFMKALTSTMPATIQRIVNPAIDGIIAPTRVLTSGALGDIANWCQSYRDEFQNLVGPDPQVELFQPWSSENNHLARAQLAINLLLYLDNLMMSGFDPSIDRVMFWGHSHAGQAFALLSNLLSNDPQSIYDFFVAGNVGLGPDVQRAYNILHSLRGPHPMAQALILVTFGTPVRYGWDTDGYKYLLHFTHHRVSNPKQPTQTEPAILVGCAGTGLFQNLGPVRQSLLDTALVKHGDWVQVFAIAGTDLARTTYQEEERKLAKVLEAGLPVETPERIIDRFGMMCPRWGTATRMHADGRNLLVQYEPTRVTQFGQAHKTVLGHGVYTMTDWLRRHLLMVMEYCEKDGVAPRVANRN